MLGWLFRPTCPCSIAAKGWVEERLEWLAAEFADSAFSGRPIVLPTPEFFPDPYDGCESSVRTLFDRVCEYMDVAPHLVDLRFMGAGKIRLVNDAGQDLPQSAATYEEGRSNFIIRIDRSELGDPMGLVGTMAHELAHVRLLGESRIKRNVYDNELLTDLTTVHFGLGIFLANGPRNFASQNTTWPGTDLPKPEYMTPPMFGWALAHLAWFRGEERPPWANHLKLSARTNMKQGLRYLLAKGDSWYRPMRLRRRP